ncbi:hypothetical protein [Arsenophonus endosymbiont of Aleurodicus floccissimus]|uniref:hypothetical protein n=1 Tax=Arsenophonus endosymbiont of Aleurodicus floccissimus TaxID=2152761 RepID=UPI003F6E98F4
MNAQNITLVGSETIDSQQLLLMVNETRKEHGEPPIRNNKFIENIKDELEGEYYTKSVVQKMNNTESEVIEMTLKQALRVVARESKAVRRSLIDKLERQSKLQSANEIIAAMTLANVAQERRLKSIEHQVEQVLEEIEHIKQDTIPTGFQGIAILKQSTA